MNATQISEALSEMAGQVARAIEPSSFPIAFVGIQQGGDKIASQLAAKVGELTNTECPLGTLDITLYRDDAATSLPDPQIGPTHIPFDVHGADVVLVDDVLQTGRTVRAALDCLLDHGRPRRIWLAALVDRGQRELPIRTDFVGALIEVPKERVLKVQFENTAQDQVISFLANQTHSEKK